MKKIIILLAIISAFLIGRYFYKQYKQQQTFKSALINELEIGIRDMDSHQQKNTIVLIDKIENLKEEARNLHQVDKNTLPNLYFHSDLNYLKYTDFPKDDIWKSFQQSGFLKSYSMWELRDLNQAYSRREELIEAKKALLDFENFIPSYLNNIQSGKSNAEKKHLELYGFYNAYLTKLMLYSCLLYTSDVADE